MPFHVSRTAHANGLGSFLQPIMDLSIDCMWCGRTGINPVSKSQRTCGKQGCGEKQNRYKSQILIALRAGKASGWGMKV